ncbi:MAG: sigma-54 dependent transcriptional regulator [Bacteroidota bacterium]
MVDHTPIKIYAVEDDPVYTKFLTYVFDLNPEIEVKFFTDGKSCLNALHELPNIVTLDYSLPDMDGNEVLKAIKQTDSHIQVIIVSGQDDISTAVELLKLGAYDYITKNEDTKDRLLMSINNASKNIKLINELAALKQEIGAKYDFSKSILGSSPAIKQVFNLLEKAIRTNIIVSITGETGTGKELVAKAVHYHSERKKHKFVAVNIAAIPNELLESELFGHEKGAFTGASSRRIGKFEEANEGTVFLDEIGEMDINMQAKILRVLQEKEITRIGGNETIKVSPRIVAATHRDLTEEVKKGNFREDLYYRLLGLPIHIPPLRERGNDIIIISLKILDEFCKENKLDAIELSSEAKEKLLKYHYPGNVRELKSIIELSAVMCTDNLIKADDIIFKSVHQENNITLQEQTLKDYEAQIIDHYLTKYNNNVMKVAEILAIGKSTIYRHLNAKKDA